MNNLIPINFKNQIVITTELLATIYETDVKNIQMNFSNHKDNFVEGKHYYKLDGEALKDFRLQVNDIGLQISSMVRTLYLWTERGANRHCKILDTDKAWEQFDNLEETYFTAKEKAPSIPELSPQLQLLINMELKQKELEERQALTDKEAGEFLAISVKIYGDLENPLFLAKDVAEWIEHSNATEMLRGIDESEKLNSTILSAGQKRDVTFLTENEKTGWKGTQTLIPPKGRETFRLLYIGARTA